MSGSPPHESADDGHGPGTAADPPSNNAGGTEATPKRGRGRPKGSKNKKSGTSTVEVTGEEAPPPKRKRGRPPKRKAEDESADPPPKRKRGRPPKNPKPETDEDADHVEPAESSTAPKKKRPGRPRKVAND